MTYAEAIEYLHSLQMFGMRLGLEPANRLAGEIGNPHARLRFIHVAGTNGKGSVCAMLESIYRQTGLRVGLFTSPHLVSFTERIQINRQPISEAEVVRWVELLREKTAGCSQPLTFFEVVTVMALGYFAEQGCDLVVWETGLGGRLDATNIVTPLASVITNIDLDHQDWLGATYAQIASEKAGIIKAGRPVITAAIAGRGLEVIAATARERGCVLTVIGPHAAGSAGGAAERYLNEREAWQAVMPGETRPMPKLTMAGAHQRTNAAVALATVGVLAGELPVAPRAIRAGLETASWPGRMQLIENDSGQKILLDGAHNGGCAMALRNAFEQSFAGVRPTLILGVLADKDWIPMVQALAPLASRILLVPVGSKRTLPPGELAAGCRAANPAAQVEVCRSLADALAAAARDPFLLITGSLYLVGEAMELMRVLAVPPVGERALNEWSGSPRSEGDRLPMPGTPP